METFISSHTFTPKIALVLSGGGALGAFQFGAVKYIEEEIKKKALNFDYSSISGVSVGALNAVMLASNQYENLKDVWENITYTSVFKGKLPFPSFIRPLLGFKSILSNKPLEKLINRHISLSKVDKKYSLYIGVVSLFDGKYYSLAPSDFKDDRNFRKTILASTSIPVLNRPVKKVSLKDGRVLKFLIDGGIRHVSPLADVLADEPDILIVINCTPKVSENKKAAKNIVNIAQIALTQIMINQSIKLKP